MGRGRHGDIDPGSNKVIERREIARARQEEENKDIINALKAGGNFSDIAKRFERSPGFIYRLAAALRDTGELPPKARKSGRES